jgi:hypothetical protein
MLRDEPGESEKHQADPPPQQRLARVWIDHVRQIRADRIAVEPGRIDPGAVAEADRPAYAPSTEGDVRMPDTEAQR